MRLTHLAALIKVNLIYANPQMVENQRNREAKTGRPAKVPAYLNVVLQSVVVMVIFLGVYGLMLSALDFTQYPGYFTFYMLMFSALTILQGFFIIYNLFYESKDLAYYLPLPFQGSEVFLAKLTVLVVTVLPYLAPVYALFFLLGKSAGHTPALNVLLATSLFLLLAGIIFLFAVLLVHLITRLSLFQKNSRLFSMILYALSNVGVVGVIFYFSSMSDSTMEMQPGMLLPDFEPIAIFLPFHQVAAQPGLSSNWMAMLPWGLALAGLGLLMYRFVIPTIYGAKEEVGVPARKEAQGQAAKPLSIRRSLWKYNFNLIQDGTLIMQFLTSTVILPVFMAGPGLIGSGIASTLPLAYWGLAFFSGFIYTFVTFSSASIVGVLISLDRENFLYMKSLPFSMTYYLKQKLLLGMLLQTGVPLVVAAVILVFAGVPLLLTVSFLLGLLVGALTQCQYYFVRDYRLLNLDWQNLMELFTRGGGNFVQTAIILGSLLFGAIAIFLLVMLHNSLESGGQMLLAIGLVLVPILVGLALTNRYRKTFWPQFEN